MSIAWPACRLGRRLHGLQRAARPALLARHLVPRVAATRAATLDSSVKDAVRGHNLIGGASKLSDIAKVPLLVRESPVRVREIWLERFKDDPSKFAGAMSNDEYAAMQANAAVCPMFLVPVPRGDGYVNLLWQAQGNRVLFKTLEAFQRGDQGAVDVGLTMFTELLGSHQLVLLQGSIHTPLLTKAEGARIIRYCREAYVDPVRFAWVKKFNQNPREFDYEEFMSEFRPLERWHNAAA
eukprot:TRINITY_DN125504_c0_g1_i1.p1 TRINITY_DN125504_c0_g1~~TRINITY_DN125504_c0_g1_i1.p1  ORF type:complete len:238 (-),score=28.71 TRINITY_DN125504_c0_g1_i1:110-823(-)